MTPMEGQARDGHDVTRRDPAQLRVSDADRHAVAEVLRTAAGEGRLDLEELDERLEATYAAKTYADLVPLTADLPVAGGAHIGPTPATPRPPLPASGAPSYPSSFAVMSETKRQGAWEVPAKHNAAALMGSVVLDLREAHLTAQETVIEAYAIMGGVDVVVNAWTRVVVDGVGIMGDFNEARPKVEPELSPHSPVVRVKGLALMGEVSVRRKPMPGEKPRRLLGRG
ncbi:MAG: DUF1707 domain-containing protein [Actinomycetes bacterium]